MGGTEHESGEESLLVERLEELAAATRALTQEVERLQRWHPLAGDVRHVLWRNFLRGMAFGLGQTVGAVLLVGVLVWLLSQLEVVPVLGEWIARLLEAIQAAQGRLP